MPDNQTNQEQDNQGQQQNQGANPGQTQQASGHSGSETLPQNWDEVLAGLPEEHRNLYQNHTNGLRSALENERAQRRDLAKQLREATTKMEEGSAARQALEKATADMEAAEQRASFYEDATRPEVGCGNVRLAYIAAQEIDAFDRRGNANWDALKKAFPELFVKPKPPSGNAGAGVNNNVPSRPFNMNDAVRHAAGRNKL